MATFDDFMKLDIRVGTITEAKVFEKARKPAYQLVVDFGEEIGKKRSSAQITDHYTPEGLVGKQVLAVVNFPPRQIADFMSEVLVLGTYSEGGVVLITPDKPVKTATGLAERPVCLLKVKFLYLLSSEETAEQQAIACCSVLCC